MQVISNPNIDKTYRVSFSLEDIQNEQWKNVTEILPQNQLCLKKRDKILETRFDLYVSTLGRVGLSQDDKIYVKPISEAVSGSIGYSCIGINKSRYTIHRLVALLFISNSNPSQNTVINHKDENKYNNRVSNLEWCTVKYNNNYGQRNLKLAQTNSHKIPSSQSQKARNTVVENSRRKILCINTSTNETIEFNSLKEAANYFNIDSSIISKCCRNIIKQYNEYQFKYNDNKKIKSRSKVIYGPIIRMDPNTKEYKVYLTKKDIINDGFRIGRVRECCDKKHYIYSTYSWYYLKDFNDILSSYNLPNLKLDIKICMLTDANKLIKLYNNLYELINDLYIVDSVIACCKGERKKYVGRKWMFLNDYLKFKNVTDLSQLNPLLDIFQMEDSKNPYPGLNR